jgi:hypothetical protein
MQKRFFLIGMTLLLLPAMMWAQEMRHLTPEQSAKALRLLRQHNTFVQYCGCCAKDKLGYVHISEMTVKEDMVHIVGEDIAKGSPYEADIDLAAVWLPMIKEGELQSLDNLAVSVDAKADPCTKLVAPANEVMAKLLEIEKDGLMDATTREAPEPLPAELNGRSFHLHNEQLPNKLEKRGKVEKLESLEKAPVHRIEKPVTTPTAE